MRSHIYCRRLCQDICIDSGGFTYAILPVSLAGSIMSILPESFSFRMFSSQDNLKEAAFAYIALSGDGAIMQFDNFLHNRQP